MNQSISFKATVLLLFFVCLVATAHQSNESKSSSSKNRPSFTQNDLKNYK